MRAETLQIDGVRWWLRAGVSPREARPLLEETLRQLTAGEARNQKHGRRKALFPLRLGDAASPDHLLKVNDYTTVAGWRRARRFSKARHELAMAEAVAARGLETVLPLAAGERRAGSRLRQCLLLVPVLAGATDLRRLWFESDLDPRGRGALVRAWGTFSRRVHESGVFQEDFAPNNFLRSGGETPRLFIIDFERAALQRRNGPRQRRFMLAKLDRHMAGASLTQRMRFLDAYTGGDREAAHRWWHELAAAAPRLACRDRARMGRTATQDGRRFVRVATCGWSGFARRDTDLPRLIGRAEDLADGSLPRPGIQAHDTLWTHLAAKTSKREARRRWVTANFLHARGGLFPQPLALLQRGDRTLLFLERQEGSLWLAEHEDARRADAEVAVLLARLLSIGALRELGPHEIAFEEGPDGWRCAVLLAPDAFQVRRRPLRDPAPRARAMANDLVTQLHPS